MKNILTGSLLAGMLMFAACFKEPDIRFGFDTDFTKNSKGLTIMYVNKNVSVIKLSGGTMISEGELVVELIDPAGITAFIGHYTSPGHVVVNEWFNATAGNWKLKYNSINGTGSLKMHLFMID